MSNVATAPTLAWQFNDVLGHDDGDSTTLRHLACDAELSVRGGRLIAGNGYRSAPADCRRALARTGAILRLRQRGHFYVHAAAVVDPIGRAWLLCGASGAGKSTLAYALARRGWRLLGDDGVIVKVGESGGGATMAYSWRERVRVTVGARGLFPELRAPSFGASPWCALEGDARERAQIELVQAREAPIAAIIWVAKANTSSQASVSSIDALTWLIAQSAWVLLGDAHGARHLEALTELARMPQFRVAHSVDLLAVADETLLALI